MHIVSERKKFEWRLRSRRLSLGSRTLLMGIVNVTPDSFSDGGAFRHSEAAIAHALRLVEEGADIIDIGGESTRPGSHPPVTQEEEQARVLPVIRAVKRLRPDVVISVDTYKSATARAAVEAGAEIVNDVSGLSWNKEMANACAELGCGVVVMHTRGRWEEWSNLPPLATNEVVPMVIEDLRARSASAMQAGIARECLLLDPGVGFGKRMQENYPMLADFAAFSELGLPLMAGSSRKGFLARAIAERTGEEQPAMDRRLYATLAANTAAILGGAHILRVHDVRAALEAAAVADAVRAAVPSRSPESTQALRHE